VFLVVLSLILIWLFLFGMFLELFLVDGGKFLGLLFLALLKFAHGYPKLVLLFEKDALFLGLFWGEVLFC
jgi:hypothetical protein